MPQLIEELFRQRLVVEVQAEGSYKAGIIFGYDYAAETIFRSQWIETQKGIFLVQITHATRDTLGTLLSGWRCLPSWTRLMGSH